MKKKSISTIKNNLIAFIILILLFSFVSYLYSPWLFIAEIMAAVMMSIATLINLNMLKDEVHRYFNEAARSVKQGSESLMSFNIPIMVTNNDGEIVWYNESFRINVIKETDIYGNNQSFIFNEETLLRLEDRTQVKISFNGRKFNVFEYITNENNQKMYFFVDETNYFQIAKKYKESRLCVMFIRIDDLDILLKNAMESEKTAVTGEIQKQIELINNGINGYFQKISSTKYVLIVERVGFDKIVEDKFSILSKVRELDFGDKRGASLSIGVGVDGDSLPECVEFANQALDMALGRGGDQAVIKSKEDFKFFGGIIQTEQLNSQVRTRVIATTLLKLIKNSENVLIMGHSYSDMDSFGAAYAMWHAVTELARPAKIVINLKKSLALPLINKVTSFDAAKDCIVAPDEAIEMVNHKTLLIIVDTHRPSFLEDKKLYELAPTVVVIDHHRKTVDFIDDSLLFYHNPSASSACEMVTELLQYMGTNLIGITEAEALFAGIMLDTRNFVLRTGTRTFEASALLRGRGADPVEVKKLFNDSMDIYIVRSRIVSQAEIFGDSAISICEEECSNLRIACSQAADELLTISGVNASFVMYYGGESINISARSLGTVNVQVIMELLGGGGHQTMAAAQLDCETFETAKNKLLQAISKAQDNQA